MGRRNSRRLILVLWFCLLLVSAVLLGWRSGLVEAGFSPQIPAPVPAHMPAPGKATAKAIVPFSMLPSNHMVVQATINNKGPYRLIFDLGAPITLLSNHVSEATGVVKADAWLKLRMAALNLDSLGKMPGLVY